MPSDDTELGNFFYTADRRTKKPHKKTLYNPTLDTVLAPSKIQKIAKKSWVDLVERRYSRYV